MRLVAEGAEDPQKEQKDLDISLCAFCVIP
jgi:hypothetical protein